ncbi:SdiA-regulated domain-containing protein [Pseudomonas sp. BAY1663]|nr:SdiA-regulated domain-containing protein [Pseudomonas sp. BAY1663]
MPVRYSRWRLLGYALLLFVLAAVLVTGRLLHWDDQLRLYWDERSVSPEQRAAGIWLPDYELALETTLAGLEEDETSGLTWNPLTGTLFTVTSQNPQLVEFTPAGVVLRRIPLSGFADPEAVEALGDGRLAIVDERRRLVAVFRLEPDVETLDLDDLASYDLASPMPATRASRGWPGTHIRNACCWPRNGTRRGCSSCPSPVRTALSARCRRCRGCPASRCWCATCPRWRSIRAASYPAALRRVAPVGGTRPAGAAAQLHQPVRRPQRSGTGHQAG